MVPNSDFMVNPYIAMNNGDRDVRIAEWSRRVKLQDDKDNKNSERRRRAQLKKQNQQKSPSAIKSDFYMHLTFDDKKFYN